LDRLTAVCSGNPTLLSFIRNSTFIGNKAVDGGGMAGLGTNYPTCDLTGPLAAINLLSSLNQGPWHLLFVAGC